MKTEILFILFILFMSGCTKIHHNEIISIDLPKECGVYTMHGKSMEPRIMKGDSMIVCWIDETEQIGIGEIACFDIGKYCAREDCEKFDFGRADTCCHRVVGIDEDGYKLKSEAWHQPTQTVKRDEIISKVRGILI